MSQLLDTGVPVHAHASAYLRYSHFRAQYAGELGYPEGVPGFGTYEHSLSDHRRCYRGAAKKLPCGVMGTWTEAHEKGKAAGA